VSNNVRPYPFFDTLSHLCDLYKRCQNENPRKIILPWLTQCLRNDVSNLPDFAVKEYYYALTFLYNYRGSLDTFNAYRREIERLIQWSWFIHQRSILQLKRLDIEAFIEFCQQPPKRWIGIKTVSRFIDKAGERIANPNWRPFIAKISKKEFQDGKKAEKTDFELSQQGIRQLFAILGSFYNNLVQEEATEVNPVLQIRQKSKFIRKQSQAPAIRRLSDLQWQMVLKTAHQLSDNYPACHERTLFIMQLLYGMYLRISELVASPRWQPKMADFFRDSNGNWWFKTVGKGNKMRQIALSPFVLTALKRYRIFRNLSPLPSPDDQSPLIPKEKGAGPVESTRIIRRIVQNCFDVAVARLRQEGKNEEAEMLRSATVHWLRHTGISDDVKYRPREHVRDDAGHSSSAITDRYIDVELQARACSARKKRVPVETASS
jgi:site-specific recombinase XerD